MYYKNISNSVKTFYGKTFKPGEIKEVPGYINNRYMIVAEMPKEPAKQHASSSPVKQDKKAEEKKLEPAKVVSETAEQPEVAEAPKADEVTKLNS